MQSPMIRVFLAAGAAALLLAGCGKADKAGSPPPAEAPATPAPAGPEPAAVGPEQGMSPDGPAVSVGPAAARVTTPAYAPLYPGAVVSSSIVGESGVGPGGSVGYRANATPEAVIAFYEARMKAVGKTITMNQDMGDNVHMLTAGDTGDGKGAVQVIASPAGKGAEVQLTWSDP